MLRHIMHERVHLRTTLKAPANVETFVGETKCFWKKSATNVSFARKRGSIYETRFLNNVSSFVGAAITCIRLRAGSRCVNFACSLQSWMVDNPHFFSLRIQPPRTRQAAGAGRGGCIRRLPLFWIESFLFHFSTECGKIDKKSV